MFTKSENIKLEYCAQIVKIGELLPIEGSDFLVKTMIGGAYQVVVGKNDVKEGDIMIYCKLETAINADFLSVNNQFEIGERELNRNFDEVQALINDGKTDEAKKMVGYFNKHGRVRIVKLRGCPSEGCLFTIDSLVKWNKKVSNFDFEQCFKPNADGIVEPFNFDTIDGQLFLKAYVPKVNEPSQRSTKKERKRHNRIEKFDRMIENQWHFHYDTCQLKDNMWRFNPESVVCISNKLHGTSHIVGNVLVKKPLPESVARKIQNKKLKRELKMLFRKEFRFYWQKQMIKARSKNIKNIINSQYTVDYGMVTSSRGIIKNQYINKGVTKGYYGYDIWSDYGNLLYPYLEKGMTVYSEIIGFLPNGGSIQKGYDYGCGPTESKIMPYRITFTDADGNVDEWNAELVYGWTVKMMKDHPEIANRMLPMVIFYHGKLGDLYPEMDQSEHWNENVLKRMMTDKEHFGMEENEPMCKNKVPREGIVIRIDDDVRAEAFKLKTIKFLGKEAELMDKGQVDIEMADAYGEN